jgi:NitT/TauT family transport system ATP-binding protein
VTEPTTRPRAEHHALVVRLPSASVGALTGMLERLADDDGRAPLSSVAASLQYDIEDLLGCVDAVELLGFAASAGGDLELTPSGRAFVEASIEGKQDRFREALLTRVPNVRNVVERLQASPDHRLTVDDVLDTLELHFSAEESRRQLEVLIDWGRYAEAFAFDAQRGLLTPAR